MASAGPPTQSLDPSLQKHTSQPRSESEPGPKKPRAERSSMNEKQHPRETQDASRQPQLYSLLFYIFLDIIAAIATIILLSFSPSSTPEPTAPQSAMQRLAQSTRHSSLSLYLAAYTAYSAVGLYNIVHPPKYWPESGFVAVIAGVAVGGWYGPRAMADAMVLGGLLSLVAARGVDFMGARGRGVGSIEGARAGRVDEKVGGLGDVESGRGVE
ncbi:hypothetical protein QBC39DRAFT_44525 [Podospora conica]|nr:hypothetical protein QBC39DRAFT_44525 [Schizothecium conicum]